MKSTVKVRLNNIEVLVSLPFINALTNFFVPEEEVNIDRFIFAAAERARNLQKVSVANAQDILSSANTTIFDVELAPPIILIPADPSWEISRGLSSQNGNDLLMFVNLGKFKIKSDQESIDSKKKYRNHHFSLDQVVAKDVTPFENMSPEYERLNITIEGIQAVIARQDMEFWDNECQLTHNLRLLSNLNIDIKLDTCIAPFHVESPAMRVTADVAELNLEISSRKISQINRLIEIVSIGGNKNTSDHPEYTDINSNSNSNMK